MLVKLYLAQNFSFWSSFQYYPGFLLYFLVKLINLGDLSGSNQVFTISITVSWCQNYQNVSVIFMLQQVSYLLFPQQKLLFFPDKLVRFRSKKIVS